MRAEYAAYSRPAFSSAITASLTTHQRFSSRAWEVVARGGVSDGATVLIESPGSGATARGTGGRLRPVQVDWAPGARCGVAGARPEHAGHAGGRQQIEPWMLSTMVCQAAAGSLASPERMSAWVVPQ